MNYPVPFILGFPRNLGFYRKPLFHLPFDGISTNSSDNYEDFDKEKGVFKRIDQSKYSRCQESTPSRFHQTFHSLVPLRVYSNAGNRLFPLDVIHFEVLVGRGFDKLFLTPTKRGENDHYTVYGGSIWIHCTLSHVQFSADRRCLLYSTICG